MLFYYLKILHVLSAGLLLTSLFFCLHQWLRKSCTAQDHIQQQTWIIIIPFALFQLITGFTMISLQHYDFSSLWVKGSVISFLLLIAAWFTFIYLFLSSRLRKLQYVMLAICGLALLSMVFLMANRI